MNDLSEFDRLTRQECVDEATPIADLFLDFILDRNADLLQASNVKYLKCLFDSATGAIVAMRNLPPEDQEQFTKKILSRVKEQCDADGLHGILAGFVVCACARLPGFYATIQPALDRKLFVSKIVDAEGSFSLTEISELFFDMVQKIRTDRDLDEAELALARATVNVLFVVLQEVLRAGQLDINPKVFSDPGINGNPMKDWLDHQLMLVTALVFVGLGMDKQTVAQIIDILGRAGHA